MGPEWKTKYLVFATVALQIALAWWTRDLPWGAYLAVVYVVGATANHSLFLAIHEMSHNLAAKEPWINKAISLVANFPIGLPYFSSFKNFHMAHHRYQGDDGVDTDIPVKMEGVWVTGQATCYADHCLRKALFMFFQIFFYELRPVLVKPSLVPRDGWAVANTVGQVAFDAAIVYAMGWNALLYFLLSSFFAGSLHPTAGHFIAEHYVMEGRAETYSYYGPLNWVTYNVGYHNEHHDFPNVAWSKLPQVKALAPEFYDSLPKCASWTGIILRYIFDDSISPFSRMKRAPAIPA